jgi:hypothetical protein
LPPHVKKPAKTCGKTKETFNNNKGVCHNIVAIAIYIKMYLKAKRRIMEIQVFHHAKKKKRKRKSSKKIPLK